MKPQEGSRGRWRTQRAEASRTHPEREPLAGLQSLAPRSSTEGQRWGSERRPLPSLAGAIAWGHCPAPSVPQTQVLSSASAGMSVPQSPSSQTQALWRLRTTGV